jgi:DNA-binding response OmpR family regulator
MLNNPTKKVLVVEDEQVIGAICRRVLTKEGFDVILTDDGNKAIKMLAENQVDLCLLDIRTPGMDGLELYGHISRNYPSLTSKVIFMTGDSLSKNIQEFAAKAGCRLLEKPFSTQELVNAVTTISKI